MHAASFSKYLEQVTQPHHPLYHPIQLTFFACLSYIGTATLTNIPPEKGMRLTTLAYVISQLITPLFTECFEPHQNVTLVPLVGQVMQLTASFVLAKVLCNLAGHTLSFKEVRLVGTVFLITLFVFRFALLKFRQFLDRF